MVFSAGGGGGVGGTWDRLGGREAHLLCLQHAAHLHYHLPLPHLTMPHLCDVFRAPPPPLSGFLFL